MLGYTSRRGFVFRFVFCLISGQFRPKPRRAWRMRGGVATRPSPPSRPPLSPTQRGGEGQDHRQLPLPSDRMPEGGALLAPHMLTIVAAKAFRLLPAILRPHVYT